MGVPVLGYKTEELPAFYNSHSGLKVDYKVNDACEMAKIIKAKRDNNRLLKQKEITISLVEFF